MQEEFSLEKTKQEVEQKLRNSPEVVSIAGQIKLEEPNTILKFGASTSQEIAGFSDQILHSMRNTKVEDSGQLLGHLNKIMDKFDIKDFDDKKKSGLSKLFNRAKDSIEAIFKKYQTMGDEVDKVYVMLKEYETEINQTNQNLDEMFTRNLAYYEQLEKYISAGYMIIEKVKTELLPGLEQKAQQTGAEIDFLAFGNAQQNLEMLEQRVFDLELAKNIALQSMPMIKTILHGNYNLVRKINSAFIITLPIFKQSIAQSIMLKRQAIQAKATAALDEKTNELLLRNAQNTALQSKMTARLASGSFVSVDTLEKTWQTIVQGIEETKQIQKDMEQQRIDGAKRLELLQEDYKNKKYF